MMFDKCLNFAQFLRQNNNCIFCGFTTNGKNGICLECVNWLPWNKNSCDICSYPITKKGQDCTECISGNWAFDRTISPFIYDYPISSLIYKMKFKSKMSIMPLFMNSIFVELKEFWEQSQIQQVDLIIPVPLSIERQRNRKYNQAYFIAKSLNKIVNSTIDTHAVIKIKQQGTQSLSNKAQRKENIQGAFKATRNLQSLNILIVDDVMTTGTTAHALTKVLKNKGAKQVSIFALARTM